jgi:hypothetical protein
VDTEESLPSEPENSTWLAMERQGTRRWLPEPEWSPAGVAGGAGAVAAAGDGRAGMLSLSHALTFSLSNTLIVKRPI